MKDILIFFGIVVIWFALNRWILPRCGIETCCSGRCATRPCDEMKCDLKPTDGEIKESAQN